MIWHWLRCGHSFMTICLQSGKGWTVELCDRFRMPAGTVRKRRSGLNGSDPGRWRELFDVMKRGEKCVLQQNRRLSR